MTTSMPEITVVELRSNLRKHLDRVHFGGQPLVVTRHQDLEIVLVRRDTYERQQRDYVRLLQEVADLRHQLDARR